MILKYNESNDMFELEPVFVEYDDTDLGHVKITVDNASAIEAMCAGNPKRFSNFKIGLNELSDDQALRLEKVNKVKFEDGVKSGLLHEASDYVEFGLIRLKSPHDQLVKLANKEVKELSKKYWIDQLKKKLAAIRYEKEVGGVEVNGRIINTSRESQNSITTTLAAVQAGLLKEVLYKTENGFVTLSATEYTNLAMAVVKHVNACFKAEAESIAAFEQVALEDLEEDNTMVSTEEPISLTHGTAEERAEFAFNKFYK